jgi:hypothetical protein
MDRGLSREPASADESVDSSEKYLHQWTSLVSTTNWEKGRIICEWRTALKAGGARTKQYSDEVWSQQVTNVTSQHVGRLRRVYERFGESRDSYEGLFWSHFQAALEWNDAEMWLEGAVQSGWSVSQMRRKRWETLGDLDVPEPRDVDIVSADVDEDASNEEDDATASADGTSGKSRNTSVRDLDEANAELDEDEDDEEQDESDEESDGESGGKEKAEAFRPFDKLPDLPEDLAEAFESFKLGILRHKLNGWAEIGRDDVLATLEALKQLVVAPA